MADLETNRAVWNADYDWSQGGEEWSGSWGGTPALWYGSILPRIHAHVPAATILEIAPGFGRWTNYLKDLCERLVVVDLAERCIDHCRERFASSSNIDYHVGDGRSLEMVADHSIDLAFSFDSLVHADAEVIGGYLVELARKLSPDGVGFVHHSNAGRYRRLASLSRRAAASPRTAATARRLVRAGALLDVYAWRAEDVTAEVVAEQCRSAGLACISQETFNWEHGSYMTDALTAFTPRGSRYERPCELARNPYFRREAVRVARLYGRD
ncbi:MAG: hypothetical protein NVSMB25_03080 [Thermoleophilaceae bacterium]